jgi:succinate dehydrogenase hydrophobic anchor subunit
MLSKTVIIVLLLAILASLFSGMAFLVRDPSDKRRVARALTVRIVLSVALIVFLVVGFFMGWIQPHGIGG